MEQAKRFKKTKEDFTCEKCGFFVEGNGYTNHCPKCLYSKHVDNNPGDRLSTCGGLMKPVRIEGEEGKYKVLHKCETCGYEKINKLADADDIDTVTKVIADYIKRIRL